MTSYLHTKDRGHSARQNQDMDTNDCECRECKYPIPMFPLKSLIHRGARKGGIEETISTQKEVACMELFSGKQSSTGNLLTTSTDERLKCVFTLNTQSTCHDPISWGGPVLGTP